MMNNTKLRLNRVVIRKDGKDAYNQIFHQGINVIRGENSTGKSTIMELISYGLGADIKKQHWKEEALLCNEIVIDLYLNKNRFVFKRRIEGEGSKPPIQMKEGDYDHSMKSTGGWKKYGYRKTDKRVSFASKIFDLLGYDQHATTENDNLTIHQLFRLLYADQDTPASNIFRWESLNYDKESMRKAIGEFLFGFDDLTIHSLRQELIAAEKSFEKLDEELKAVYKILGKTNIKATSKELNAEISNLNNDLTKIEEKRKNLKHESINAESEELAKEADLLNKKISKLSTAIANLEGEITSITYDIQESEEFLKTLNFRKTSIKNSQATVNSLGMVEFQYCPSCLSKIEPINNPHTCALCKSDVSEKIINESYLQALEQLDFQYKETEDLINKHKATKAVLTTQINSNLDEINRLKIAFKEINTYSDDYEFSLIRLASEEGFIQSQIQSLKDKLELAAEIDLKVQEKVNLQSVMTNLKDQLQRHEASQIRRKSKVLDAISSTVTTILSNDTGTEDSFLSANKFELDFAQNIMLLDGRANFSASSNVLLKNAFHLATLIVSCSDNQFRIPCFTMFDNIEDKGMTSDRSQNFQDIVLNLCSKIDTEFQLLMTTSMVSESLNNETFGVGPYYNKGEHTLSI